MSSRLVTLVWAADRAGAIGRGNSIPWHVPEDLRHFREVTGSNPVVMGRRTWESLPERFRPLPGRRNIVVTRSPDYPAAGAEIADNVAAAIDLGGERVSVIGGGAVYATAMEFATQLSVTEIDLLIDDADTFAPAIDTTRWALASSSAWQTSRTGTRFRFLDYRVRDDR